MEEEIRKARLEYVEITRKNLQKMRSLLEQAIIFSAKESTIKKAEEMIKETESKLNEVLRLLGMN